MNTKSCITFFLLLLMVTAWGQSNVVPSGAISTFDLKQFQQEFRALINDYGTNFSKAKGARMKDSFSELGELGGYEEYACKLPLTIAKRTFLDNLNSRHLAFNASTESFRTKQEAENLLTQMESCTDALKINCCTLAKQKNMDSNGLPELVYQPNQFLGKNNDLYYHNFTLKYNLEKKFSTDLNRDAWVIIIRMWKEQQYGGF